MHDQLWFRVRSTVWFAISLYESRKLLFWRLLKLALFRTYALDSMINDFRYDAGHIPQYKTNLPV